MEEKNVRNANIRYFLGKTHKWYRYPQSRGEVVPVPIGSRVLVPIPVQVVTGIDASYNPIFACYAILSPVFVHRLFRDPNK